MPWLLAATVQEMWQAANMGFGLVLLLNQGAIDAIHHHGSAEQKADLPAQDDLAANGPAP